MINRILFILICIVSLGCQKENLPQSIVLNSHWQFKNYADSLWSNATVPGNIHSDLLRNKLIKDPFIGSNALELQWISNTDWEYKTAIFYPNGKGITPTYRIISISKKKNELNRFTNLRLFFHYLSASITSNSLHL